MTAKKLVLSFVALVILITVASCAGPTPTEVPPTEVPPTEVPPTEVPTEEVVPTEVVCPYNESPMLAELVEAGELPSVCERLPKNPLVLTGGMMLPREYIDPEIGVYGGEMVMTILSNVDMKEPLFITNNRNPKFVSGNIVESLTWNDDLTEFTFKLREGHKWSDGTPLTTEDVRFAYEEVVSNELLYAAVPGYLRAKGRAEGEPAKLEIVDDFTFVFKFAEPYPTFPFQLVSIGTGYLDIIKPKHYLEQFHIDYGDADEIAAMAEKEGLTEWYELFNLRDLRGWSENNPEAVGFPQLGGWIRLESPEDRIVVERNPYYHAVDTAGNQLPYIDRRVTVPLAWTNPEAAQLMMFSKQADYHWFLDATVLPLFKENEAKGNYKTVIYPNKDSRGFYLNLTYDDPAWREVTWDVRFRRAILLAIDKQEINDELYAGVASLPTTNPPEYNPEKANSLLDEMGLTERDADGFRLGPDGKPIEIFIEVGPWEGYKEQAPFFCSYFEEIGIKCNFKEFAAEAVGERQQANEHKAAISWNTAPIWDAHGPYVDYLPTALWGPLWQDWYESGGETGEEPPDWIKELYAIHDEIVRHPWGADAFYQAAEKRDAWIYENVPFFTFVEQPAIFHVWSNCLGNVPGGRTFHHGSWTSHKLLYFIPGCER